MSEGLAHHRMIVENGRPQDYVFLEVNRAFEQLTGLKDVVGRRVTEVIPGIKESQPELFEVYGRVAMTGKPEKLEIYVDALQAWFSVSAYSMEPGCFTAVFENITERKRAVEALAESERRHRLLFNSVSDALFVHEGAGADGALNRFTEVNDVACERLGYTREELLQMSMAQIAYPAAPKFPGGSAADNPAFWEGVHVTKDGKRIPVEISSRLFHLNGKATYISTARDISSRKEAESLLRTGRQRLHDIIEETPAGYFFIDQNGRFQHVNRAWLKMHGYSALEEVAGAHFSLTQTGADLKAAEKWVARIMAGERIQAGEFSRRLKDGSTAFHSFSAGPVSDGGKIIGLEGFLIDITPLKQAEANIQQNQAELKAVYDSTPLMMCLVNSQRQVERMNRNMAEFAGGDLPADTPHGPGDLLGCVNALDDARGCGFGALCRVCPLRLAVVKTFKSGQPCHQVEAGLFLARNGVRREIQVSASTALVRLQGQPKVLVCLEDITGRKQLEAQFFQAQKMEAIGQLSGGIAHDFNNILVATILHLNFLNQKQNLDPDIADSLRELEKNIQRAAGLTRQLLQFSSRHVMQPKREDFNEVIQGLMKMLGRLLGENIEMVFTPDSQPVWVEADEGMLEQLVMNLCVNARDAMPQGGSLKLGMQRLKVEAEGVCRHPEARPGGFACLTVTDTGCGMDEATLRRIFQPFFTTKEPGKGTGLGLATVHGIVKRHHGWIEVESVVERGTTFRVFLPAAEPPTTAELQAKQTGSRGGTETILLVEDEYPVRRLVGMALRRLGYEIIEAKDAVEAIQLWERHGNRVSLVFTDLVMPGDYTGLDLAKRLRQLKAGLKVLISSGYSADVIRQRGGLPAGVKFLNKPYDSHSLALMVRECLDEKG